MPPRQLTRPEIRKYYAMDIESRYIVTLLYAIVTADRSNDMLSRVHYSAILRRPGIATEK